jgi:uncharacterized protein YpmB
MKNNKKDTLAAIIIVAILLSSIFIMSSALKPISAQTGNSKSQKAANNYNTFKDCLSNADSTKGYATKKEIRQCITQAYPPPLNSSSSPDASTDTGGVVTPAG